MLDSNEPIYIGFEKRYIRTIINAKVDPTSLRGRKYIGKWVVNKLIKYCISLEDGRLMLKNENITLKERIKDLEKQISDIDFKTNQEGKANELLK